MAGMRVGVLLHHVRHLLEAHPTASPDRQLLERFVRDGDEAAFAALMGRYGPLVLGVCRRRLGHVQDAEDVFQATFLVLARQAATIRKHTSVASWLYGVAQRLASQAQKEAARRRRREQKAYVPPPADPLAAITWREVRGILDEELTRLPDKYRAPVLLCYFEGQTQDEAARQLGWKKRTIKARLARARQLLRDRLSRRGLELSTVLAGPLLASDGSATVPVALSNATTRAALRLAEQQPLAGAVSAQVVALANGGARALAFSPWQVLTVGLVTAVLLGSGAGFWLSRAMPPEAEPPAKEQIRTDRYGDPLPPGAVLRLGTERFRHGNINKHLAWVPGTRVLASGEGESLRFWDALTGQSLGQIRSDDPLFTDFAYSPDGRQIVSVGWRKDLSGSFTRFWDAATGQAVRTVPWVIQAWPPSSYRSVMDWQTIVTTYDGRVTVRDLATGVELRTSKLCDQIIEAVALSPDGKVVAAFVERDPLLYLWEWESDRKPRQVKIPEQGYSMQLVFAPGGKVLATCMQNQGVIRLWDVATGRPLHRLKPRTDSPQYGGVAFSPDGKLLARVSWEVGAMRGTLDSWDPTTGKPVRQLEFDGFGVGSPTFSPDGRYLATSGLGGVRVWDLDTGKEVAASDDTHRCPVQLLAVTAGGLIATGAEDKTMRLWDVTTGRQQRKWLLGAIPLALDLSSDGTKLATLSREDDAVYLWDARSGPEIYKLAGHGPTHGRGALRFTAGGERLLSFGGDRALRTWDLRTGKAISELFLRPAGDRTKDINVVSGWGDIVGPAVFSSDGGVLAWNLNNELLVCDTATGKIVRTIPHQGGIIVGLALSPDNRLLAVSAWNGGRSTTLPNGKVLSSAYQNHPVCVWDLTTGKLRRGFILVDGGAGPVAFSPDGKRLAAGVDRPGGPIRLWDLTTGVELPSLSGFRGGVASVAFTPDGGRLISGMRDTFALIWDLAAAPKEKP